MHISLYTRNIHILDLYTTHKHTQIKQKLDEQERAEKRQQQRQDKLAKKQKEISAVLKSIISLVS